MDRRAIDDRTHCFLSADGEVAIVVDEDDGEVLRIEGENMRFEPIVEG